MALSGPHGLVTALHMCGASEEAIRVARGLIAAGLVRWDDGFYVVSCAAHYPLLLPEHTRKGLSASPVVEDWPRGMGLAKGHLVRDDVPSSPSSQLEGALSLDDRLDQ